MFKNPPLGEKSHRLAGRFCASLGHARIFGVRSSFEIQAHWNQALLLNPAVSHGGSELPAPQGAFGWVPPSHHGVRHGSRPPCSVPHCSNPCPASRRLFTHNTRVERSRLLAIAGSASKATSPSTASTAASSNRVKASLSRAGAQGSGIRGLVCGFINTSLPGGSCGTIII